MSRFSLRSCSDGFKLLEEKSNRRKSSNPTSISAKRISQQQKDNKFSTHLNEECLIDDIKIESDETEKTSDNADGPTKTKNRPGGGDDDDDEDDNDNDYYRQQSPVFKGSLVCSLPLDRINDIIQKLNLNKSKIENEKESDELMIDETLDNEDDEDDDANISKQSASNIKNLCLYCDRKFSSHKMQLKHVDKFHCLQQDRRSSGRTAQMQNSQVPRKRKSAIGHNFPGCNYCQKAKGQSQPVILQASDLSSLFVHFIDCHADKYFGCKICTLRFQNITKLSKHMEIVHKRLPFAFDENSCKSKDNDTDSLISNDKLTIGERSKLSLKRQQRSQKSLNSSSGSSGGSSTGLNTSTSQCSTAITPNTSVIGAEEPILSRLGLTQNRLPNNRKGVRLRREKLLPELLLKSEQNPTTSSNYAFGQPISITASAASTCSQKLRGKSIKTVSVFTGDTSSDVVFRVPTRNDILSCVFDDNFYKEVVANVRNNLLFHLDGKIMGNSQQNMDASLMRHTTQPQIRSTLVKSPLFVNTVDSEIHAATSLAAITAFPTLLTAQQFGGERTLSKIRRPHTKNSWKWKWDNVKKFKLINEGGKIIKKMKHPMLGLRDLSKLDMWTQLTMRQKHELLQQQDCNLTIMDDNSWHNASNTVAEVSSDSSREDKQRLNDQLNLILDMRLLPHIILEQNEQAIIKLENDEFGIAPTQLTNEDCGDNFMAQTFADESFLSLLNLLPTNDSRNTRTKLVLSGEWARPRCYLCICCGAKFEKLKSLEEHKMFRHSQILSTHYEVVGRELLNGNLLRHLFIPKKALSRYGNESENTLIYSGAARRLFWHKNETLTREITNNDESLDSLQSVLNSCSTNSPSLKNGSSSTEDCDIDTKISTTTALELIENTTIVSPTHSIQSCSSSSSATGVKRHLKNQVSSRPLPTLANTSSANNSNLNVTGTGCSKCGRKCNGVLDLYRHMLDCSGDYIWSLAKKRKYRYYCGSKKRRPCNKHSILELRKNKPKPAPKPLTISNENTNEEGIAAGSSTNFAKTKTSPRPRPSDAESIKKMLENLPPKRICKKIFPALSKTKKSMKNIKPKLLAKHKIYNSLRKTHVRQISQAAKILSKTKSQLNKPKQMATRSSATISSTAAKNRKNQKKNNKIIINKKSNRKLEEKLPNASASEPFEDNKLEGGADPEIANEYKDEVDCCSIKIENSKAIDPLANENGSFLKPNIEVEEIREPLKKPADTLTPDQPAETDGQLSQSSDSTLKLKTTHSNESPTKPSETKSLELNISAITPNVTEITQKATESQEVVKVTTTSNVGTPTDSDRTIQINKNIKRSKRISDCIAMLTGKLEEKLKTEQRISLIPPIPEKEIEIAAVQPFQPLPPPILQPEQQKLLLPITAAETESEKSVKKTPKRKAISRRIVKTDVVAEGSILPLITSSVENDVYHNVKNTSLIEITTPVKETQSIKRVGFKQIPKTSTAAPVVTTKTLSDLVFVSENKKQIKTIPPAGPPPVVAQMPPPAIIPFNSTPLIPNVPLYLPVDNLRPTHVVSHMNSMPLPLCMPVPVPVPGPVPVPKPIENVTQVSSNSLSAAGVTTVVMPMMPTMPAHIQAPPTLSLNMPTFNTPTAAEPLNLSNSSKNVQKQSQDLSCSANQRLGGIPARRQTICGFEARNFVMFDEMEPLDLSKKPRPIKNTPIPAVLPHPIEMATLMLPPQNFLATSIDTNVVNIPPLTPEALLNKPFYSNLDLLRIPQVRNPAIGQIQVSAEPPQPSPIVVNTIAAIPLSKAANKKRNKSLMIIQPTVHTTITASGGEMGASGPSGPSGNLMATHVAKSNITKDSIYTTTKKESGKKQTILRMDEEVINHIDDAINSVINAANASLDNEEAEKALENLTKIPPCVVNPLLTTQLKTTDDVNAAKDSVGEFKYVTPARRNMRSKTLDCRPAALNKQTTKTYPTTATEINQESSDDSKVKNQKKIDNSNENLKCIDTKKQQNKIQVAITESEKFNNKTEDIQNSQGTSLELKVGPAIEPTENVSHQTKPVATEETNSHNQNNVVSSKSIEDEILSNKIMIPSSKDTATPTIINREIVLEPNLVSVADTDVSIANTTSTTTITSTTINNSHIDLEQMSNNNNTSSGFHSSAQSDQQTSVMSTSTSAISVPPAMATDTKKKQRRRRKNELAAIVADQLLESFKLDKTRRDNLKKLENLAYEMSDDLLLTGMLLMPCTKRNITSSTSVNTNAASNAAENIESSTSNTKRSNKNQRNNQNHETQKVNETCIVKNKITESTENEKDKDALEGAEVAADGKKNNKRRQYRRRGKTLDNENISKLKSSLESFSIDIERQLTEYEAKNVNVFKNVAENEVSGKQSSNSKHQAAVPKPSIILRPSILSVTLEASSGNQEPPPQSTTKSVTNDVNSKTVVVSRDPRLNKNIHKEESEKNNDEKSVANGAVVEKVPTVLAPKKSTEPEDIGDLEEDNYLTEIAKNVNEKIMSTAENEEFAFKDDGFEMVNDLGMDDSNSKFSRPPTSMSVRSAPNFNDDRSNFGSICDENTNTEVMDMDLDDEMSVYTSYSQDLGRGRGRRRRRRRSILLTRKPKKRASSRDMSAEKIECILCKKVFYSANSLSKHNMTLAHVSKVSEQEYLLSKSQTNIPNLTTAVELQPFTSLGPYARRTTRRSTISEPPSQLHLCDSNPPPSIPNTTLVSSLTTPVQISQAQTPFKTFSTQDTPAVIREDIPQTETVDCARTTVKSSHKPTKDLPDNEYDGNNGASINTAFNGNSRLNLNPDERLFFECCNILKSAETPRLNNAVTTAQECNINTTYSYSYNHQEKPSTPLSSSNAICPPPNIAIESTSLREASNHGTHLVPPQLTNNNNNNVHPTNQLPVMFRDPQSINQSNFNNKPVQDNRNARSPTYSAISQLSAVTNTTSRFKTKAAMKGYENVNVDLIQQQESKSRTICKLTELAEIALGNEEKPNSQFSPIQSSSTPPRLIAAHPPQQPPQQAKVTCVENAVRSKVLVSTPDYACLLAMDSHPKDRNEQLPTRNERTKNNETRSSTSSKTIMHSSIIKAAVEEHQKVPAPSNKIVIPDRPFKNIGLEEKETITFQKPKTPAVNLLTEDNSVSTGSFSDRDDYDFGSLSCDDEVSVRESNDKNQKNNSSDSSSESSRATAKTFENKSLIMGRIFKNASTKACVKNAVTTVKVKSVGVQKDQAPAPKADLNQLFDELRGNSGVDGHANDRGGCVGNIAVADSFGVVTAGSGISSRINHKQYQPQREISKPIVPAASPPAVVSSTTATPSTSARKIKARVTGAKTNVTSAKNRKDISKLQSELGMSPDEIKKLIDEGQRKSKRRCATNRPKKLVEIWSSDEYEEFLSTKDIIALIEEKEQQEKRKKRKSSVNISSNISEITKEKDSAPADVTSTSTKDPRRRNTRRMSMAVERQENLLSDHDQSYQPKENKNSKKTSSKKEEPVSTTASGINASEVIGNSKILPIKKSGKKGKSLVNNSSIVAVPTADKSTIVRQKRANSNVNKPKTKPPASLPPPPLPPPLPIKAKPEKTNKKIARTNYHKKEIQYDDDDDDNSTDNNEDDDDDDDDFLISELKQRQKSKTRVTKVKNTKTAAASASAAIVTSTANVKSIKSISNTSQQPNTNKKRVGSNITNKNTNCNKPSISAAASSSNMKSQQQQQQQQQPKNKRKNQTNQSPPRRKRLATEKLYYWSSSSDEDFGRINNNINKTNPPADNYENTGEQYQKHGWIVGDSHKKLVTLLAIAKGNKKVDSNCGVKKNTAKKRNKE